MQTPLFPRRALLFLCLVWCVFCLAAASYLVESSRHVEISPSYAVGFSPDESAQRIILGAVENAEKEILVAAYSFTSKPISRALAAARHRGGVDVRVVGDAKSAASKHSSLPFLAGEGVAVRINGNYSIFHHKFMILDGIHLQTGSFNYSAAAATRNSENVLILWNAPDIAASYTVEWLKLWEEAVAMEDTRSETQRGLLD